MHDFRDEWKWKLLKIIKTSTKKEKKCLKRRFNTREIE